MVSAGLPIGQTRPPSLSSVTGPTCRPRVPSGISTEPIASQLCPSSTERETTRRDGSDSELRNEPSLRKVSTGRETLRELHERPPSAVSITVSSSLVITCATPPSVTTMLFLHSEYQLTSFCQGSQVRSAGSCPTSPRRERSTPWKPSAITGWTTKRYSSMPTGVPSPAATRAMNSPTSGNSISSTAS